MGERPNRRPPWIHAGPGTGWGMRVTKADAATLRIQPGERLADDGKTWLSIADNFYMPVTFAKIDAGGEAGSTWYSLWLYEVAGVLTAALSTSATTISGVTSAKYFAGWFYNDSGSDFSDIATAVHGSTLQVLFEPLAASGLPGLMAWSDIGAHAPTTGSWQQIAGVSGTNSLGTAAWPSTRVLALLVYGRAAGNRVLQCSGNGVLPSMRVALAGTSGNRAEGQSWVASSGDLYFHVNGDNNVESLNITGYVLDRSGITEDGTGL